MTRPPLTPEDPTRAPGHTCGTIDRVKTLVRRLARAGLTPEDRRQAETEALLLLEDLRTANVRLRDLAGGKP